MSDVMLHGILNMPPDLWNETEVNKMQRYDAYKEASERIRELENAVIGLKASLRTCQSTSNAVLDQYRDL